LNLPFAIFHLSFLVGSNGFQMEIEKWKMENDGSFFGVMPDK